MSIKDFREKQIVFVLMQNGEKFSFKNDNIIVKNCDESIKYQSTCYLLFALFVCGHCTITSGLVERARKFGFTIVFMNFNMRVYAILPSELEGNVLLRKKQYEYNSLELGAYIISNKIRNQCLLLHSIRDKSKNINNAIYILDELWLEVREKDLTLQEIMGKEGVASKIYFAAVFENYNWQSRRPRVKHDVINCLLDIGYSLLFNIIHGLLGIYGFDSYVGVLHRQFYQRKSLVCDMVEPFRPIIDAALRKSLNLGQIRYDDFSVSQGQYFIGGKMAVPYIQIFIAAIMSHKESIFYYIQNYYRAFMRDKPINEFPFVDIGKA